MAAAEAILVGNRYLSDFALQYNASVAVVPTVVDSTRYQPKLKYSTHQGVRLVWIGTPITAAFLHRLLRPLTHCIISILSLGCDWLARETYCARSSHLRRWWSGLKPPKQSCWPSVTWD